MKARIILWGTLACLLVASAWLVQRRIATTRANAGPSRVTGRVAEDAGRTAQRAAQPAPAAPKGEPELVKLTAGQSGTAYGNMTSALRPIVDAKADFSQRSAALAGLTRTIGSHDLRGLYTFLQEHDADDETMRGEAFKNELMDELTRLDSPGLAAVLTGVYQDESQNFVLRDYALQHLIEQLQLKLAKGQLADGDVERVRKLLWRAVKEKEHSIGGTALLGLSRLSDTVLKSDRAAVSALAAQYATDNASGELTRLTAVQVCARMESPEAQAAILTMARSGETIPLQISAIGALGSYPTPEVRAYLAQTVAGGNPVLQAAAKQAAHRIKILDKQNAAR